MPPLDRAKLSNLLSKDLSLSYRGECRAQSRHSSLAFGAPLRAQAANTVRQFGSGVPSLVSAKLITHGSARISPRAASLSAGDSSCHQAELSFADE
jgi:hypothetical protein